MIENAMLIIAINFIRFVSSVVGDAIKTTINKSIELKLEEDYYRTRNKDFVKSTYIRDNETPDYHRFYINKKRVYANTKYLSKSKTFYPLKKIYEEKKVPLVILNTNTLEIPWDNDMLMSILKNVKGIHYIGEDIYRNFAHQELFDVPAILIDMSAIDSNHIMSSITMWNIIPGISNAQTLRLDFDKQNYDNDLKSYNYKLCDYIVTIVKIIKDTFSYCRIPLKDSLERLKIESSILYESGYNKIEFQQIDNGFFMQLSYSYNSEILVYLPFNYPFDPPTLLVKRDNTFENIEISNKTWSADCTIEQLISAMNMYEKSVPRVM